MRARRHSSEAGDEPRRVLGTVYVDDGAETFGRVLNIVNTSLREHGRLFADDADRDEWEDISQGRQETP